MGKVIYFNITYRCNSKCIFCFSNSTGNICDEMELEDIKKILKDLAVEKEDLIVINGGEPFVHKQIRSILKYLSLEIDCKKKIYTNGRRVSEQDIEVLRGFTYVIPIHGNRYEHDKVAGIVGAYEGTIESISKLQKASIDYELKFIMNSNMIDDDINIRDYLKKNNFYPKRVILARLNETKISRKNNVFIPASEQVARYVNKQLNILSPCYEVGLLDIPPCLIDKEYREIINVESEPTFFFNDVNINKQIRKYYKEVKVGSGCEYCSYSELCDLMRKSYLTMVIRDGKLYIEKE